MYDLKPSDSKDVYEDSRVNEGLEMRFGGVDVRIGRVENFSESLSKRPNCVTGVSLIKDALFWQDRPGHAREQQVDRVSVYTTRAGTDGVREYSVDDGKGGMEWKESGRVGGV